MVSFGFIGEVSIDFSLYFLFFFGLFVGDSSCEELFWLRVLVINCCFKTNHY